MIYILGKTYSPHLNLALEEYCFREMLSENRIFMLWRNTPSIIVGKYQNTLQEINTEYVRDAGIDVVRRISGGGTVYHDLNNLNFTFIANDVDRKGFDLKEFTLPVISALAKLGVQAWVSPRNDLRIGQDKICGTAQACTRRRMMFHGCLLFDSDLTALTYSLKEPKEKITSAGVKSVRSTVTNIRSYLSCDMDIELFMLKILEEVRMFYPEMREYIFSEQEKMYCEQNIMDKYTTWEWNYAMSPPFTMEKEEVVKGNKVKGIIDVSKGVIEEVHLFMNDMDVSERVGFLNGVQYRREMLERHICAQEENIRRSLPLKSEDLVSFLAK